jgi:hypothetical protein
VEEKDRKELDVAVLKYLETIRYDYDNAEFEKVVAEVMKKIEDKVRYGDQ